MAFVAEGGAQAPQTTSRTDQEDNIAWRQTGPDEGCRLFKLVMKAATGWQLDGHVRHLQTQLVCFLSRSETFVGSLSHQMFYVYTCFEHTFHLDDKT